MVLKVSSQDFSAQVLQSHQPVLVDFYAAWCGPCKLMEPILEEAEKERSDLRIAKVNVDEEPGLAQKHKVGSVPTLVLYYQGQIKATWQGLRTKKVLLNDIAAALKI